MGITRSSMGNLQKTIARMQIVKLFLCRDSFGDPCPGLPLPDTSVRTRHWLWRHNFCNFHPIMRTKLPPWWEEQRVKPTGELQEQTVQTLIDVGNIFLPFSLEFHMLNSFWQSPSSSPACFPVLEVSCPFLHSHFFPVLKLNHLHQHDIYSHPLSHSV